MRGHAFGLDLEGSFEAPGLWSDAAPAARRSAALRIVEPEAVEACRPAGERLWTHRFGPDGPLLTLDRALDGYLMRVDGWGAYRVTADGRTVELAPPPLEAWRWQRLLTAQVLPLTALVQGLELLHASTVAIRGRAIALAGQGSAGKTTLAVHLLLRGASFVTDDVLAVEPVDGSVTAHPGPPLANLRHDTARMLGSDRLARLGTLVGDDESALRIRVGRSARALPLGALCFLDRTGEPPGCVQFERLDPPDPRLLLGACFNSALRTPERLARGLDSTARLADVPAFRLRAPRSAAPEELAAAVESHLTW